ncbi:hypothetical protein C3E97_028020 [Pseudomonas sp. MWU12-2115]|uniref:hypothetical protein n=1 Tax=unclassified Pseudomonas TaxID=196821 RepID=UPI000CD4BB83|nr:hypothetical protein [Pseudomonas sp. MWU12-2020]RBB97310.1 hypothetical protein C3E97_028020 [Pseudomonas sp. MWU12-2115]
MANPLPRRPSAFTPDKTDVARAVLQQHPGNARVMIREMPVEQIHARLPKGVADEPHKENDL